MPDPRALLIDLDGVLRAWPSTDHEIEAARGLPAGAIRRIAFSEHFLIPAITGMVSDEQWRSQVASELARLYPQSDAAEAVRAWSESPGTVVTEVADLLASIAENLRLILVTNATSRLQRDLEALALAGLFHAVVNSSAHGVAKPEPGIFLAALEAAGCAPEHALFVDDSATNVRAAELLGMRAHTYRSSGALLFFLRQNGVSLGMA